MEIIRNDDYVRLNYISDFIEDFVSPSSKARLYYLLSKPKRRSEVTNSFQSDHLDTRYLHPITAPDRSADAIYEAMRKLGAPQKCFVLSMEAAYKDQVDLREALRAFIRQRTGIVLYCRDAKLGYWQGHESKQYFLHK